MTYQWFYDVFLAQKYAEAKECKFAALELKSKEVSVCRSFMRRSKTYRIHTCFYRDKYVWLEKLDDRWILKFKNPEHPMYEEIRKKELEGRCAE